MVASALTQARSANTLPSGRHGLSPEQVADHQRHRILEATIELCGRRGLGAASVLRVARTAHVAEKTIYEHYPSGRPAVLAAAFEHVAGELTSRAERAATAAPSFEAAVGGATAAALEMLATDPVRARFLLLEAPACGYAVAALRTALLARLSAALHHASLAHRGYAPPGDGTALMAVGGVSHAVADVVAQRQTERLTELRDDLLATLLALYR